jgi:hypothetical protein
MRFLGRAFRGVWTGGYQGSTRGCRVVEELELPGPDEQFFRVGETSPPTETPPDAGDDQGEIGGSPPSIRLYG